MDGGSAANGWDKCCEASKPGCETHPGAWMSDGLERTTTDQFFARIVDAAVTLNLFYRGKTPDNHSTPLFCNRGQIGAEGNGFID